MTKLRKIIHKLRAKNVKKGYYIQKTLAFMKNNIYICYSFSMVSPLIFVRNLSLEVGSILRQPLLLIKLLFYKKPAFII